MSEADQVEQDIQELTKKVKNWTDVLTDASNRGDIETLSTGLMQLARVNTALGRKSKKAMYIARIAERAYNAARDQHKIDGIKSGKSATAADVGKYVDTKQQHRAWVDALLVAEEAEDLAYKTGDFEKYCQSRQSILKEDVRRG